MIYGTPRLKIFADNTDILGVRHLEVGRMWQPIGSNLTPDQVTAQRPAFPGFAGMLPIALSTLPKDGTMETVWTFEGASTDPGLSLKTRATSTTYEFEPGFGELDLRLSPKWSTFQDQYGAALAQDGSIDWPETIDAGTASTGAGFSGAASGSASQIPNPLWGYQTYFAMQCGTYTFSYCGTSINNGFTANTGKICGVSALPGQPPNYPGCNWLGLPTKVRRRGAIFQFTECYWLSKDGGWPEPIYGKSSGSGVGDDLNISLLANGSDAFQSLPLLG